MKISKKLASISILSLLFSSSIAKQQKCHALALSGGGNKGAYEAGVVYNLAHLLAPSDVTYDVVTGVSAGAINSAGVAVFEIGKELEMSEYLVNMWGRITTETIWKPWAGGLAEGLFE